MDKREMFKDRFYQAEAWLPSPHPGPLMLTHRRTFPRTNKQQGGEHLLNFFLPLLLPTHLPWTLCTTWGGLSFSLSGSCFFPSIRLSRERHVFKNTPFSAPPHCLSWEWFMLILPRHLEMKLQLSTSLSPFLVHHAHLGTFSPLQSSFSRLES